MPRIRCCSRRTFFPICALGVLTQPPSPDVVEAQQHAKLLLSKTEELIESASPCHFKFVVEKRIDGNGQRPDKGQGSKGASQAARTFCELARKGSRQWFWASNESYRLDDNTPGFISVTDGTRFVQGDTRQKTFLTGLAKEGREYSVQTPELFSGLRHARDGIKPCIEGRHPYSVLAEAPGPAGKAKLTFRFKSTPRYFSCCYDPQTYQLVRYEQFGPDAQLQTRFEVIEYRTIDAVSYPHESKVENFRRGALDRIDTCRVDSVVFSGGSVPDGLFVAPVTRDTVIHDAEKGHVIRNSAGVENHLREVSNLIERPTRTWLYIVAVLLASATIAVLLYWRQRRRT